MTRWILGNALLAIGLLWVAASQVAFQSSFFAGTSFGGGFSVIAACVVIVAGVALLAGEIVATRPLVRNGVQLAPAERLVFSRPAVWLPATVSAVCLIACVLAFVS